VQFRMTTCKRSMGWIVSHIEKTRGTSRVIQKPKEKMGLGGGAQSQALIWETGIDFKEAKQVYISVDCEKSTNQKKRPRAHRVNMGKKGKVQGFNGGRWGIENKPQRKSRDLLGLGKLEIGEGQEFLGEKSCAKRGPCGSVGERDVSLSWTNDSRKGTRGANEKSENSGRSGGKERKGGEGRFH